MKYKLVDTIININNAKLMSILFNSTVEWVHCCCLYSFSFENSILCFNIDCCWLLVSYWIPIPHIWWLDIKFIENGKRKNEKKFDKDSIIIWCTNSARNERKKSFFFFLVRLIRATNALKTVFVKRSHIPHSCSNSDNNQII